MPDRSTPPISANDPLWYKDAIIYQTHVKAFRDSNGDGYGDFPGLIQKLDYIQSLNVNTLWLLPFYPSPLRDDGYDIAEYESVHPQYGTLEDFQRLLDESHARNIRVITELVINHTSDQHAWFQRARSSPRGSPERNWYVWSDDPTKYKDARIIFTDTEVSNWTWDPVAEQFYWHRFFSHQPDLNFDNPEVLDAVIDVMRFWLRMGVDGMRLDAIPYLIERDGTNCENLPETHVILQKIRSALDAEFENKLLLAEANQWPINVIPYFGGGKECHMAFHFPLMPRMYMAIRKEDRSPIVEILAQTPEIPDVCQWAIFLRNHDELTLEMVTDEERDYMYREYATQARMRINVGIRRRLASLLDNGRRQIELMNALLLTMPGTPIIYYGDEIGMGDNVFLGDRNGVRTPMQWNGGWNSGFSDADQQALYFPLIMDPPYGYQGVNVAAQERTQTSLLRWMRAHREGAHAASRLRPRHLRDAPPRESRGARLSALVRRRDDPLREQSLALRAACAHQSAALHRHGAGRDDRQHPLPAHQRKSVPLRARAAQLLLVQAGLSRRSAGAARGGQTLTLTVAGALENALAPAALRSIDSATLVEFLRERRWFGEKSQASFSARIADVIPVMGEGQQWAVTRVEVTLDDGSVASYQLPLSVREREMSRAHAPAAVLALVESTVIKGLLFDAIDDPAFRARIARALSDGEHFPGDGASLRSERVARSGPRLSGASHVVGGEQSNSSIIFGESAIFKLFRRLEGGESPDVEIARYLTAHTSFRHTPELYAVLVVDHDGERTVAGMLSRLVAGAMDGWAHALARARAYTHGDGDARHDPFEREAEQLGAVTAELHRALAQATDDPAFAHEGCDRRRCRALGRCRATLRRARLRAARSPRAQARCALAPARTRRRRPPRRRLREARSHHQLARRRRRGGRSLAPSRRLPPRPGAPHRHRLDDHRLRGRARASARGAARAQ